MSEFSLFELFCEEVATHAAVLGTGLIAAEAETPDAQTLEPLMRAAHSLKGAARVVGLDTVVTLAHAMEEDLVAAQQGTMTLTPSRIDLLLRVVDWIVALAAVGEPALPQWLVQQAETADDLLTQLRNPAASAPDTASPATHSAPASLAAGTLPVGEASAGQATPDIDRAVRLSAGMVTRFLALSSEVLVEAHRLDRLTRHFQDLWRQHERLKEPIASLRKGLATGMSRGELLEFAMTAAGIFDDNREQLTQRVEELSSQTHRSSLLAEQLFLHATSSRQRPFDDGVQSFPRLVRDVARDLGKQVRFEILGRDTQVDRDTLEKLEAPLRHLLQNAVDHGLEPPDERRSHDKEEWGTLRLEAHHQDGALWIEVADDGRGIDRARLTRRIVDAGLTTEPVAMQLDDKELFDFLFLPGVSTRSEVSLTSGRGVGLDVVQTMVHAEGGALFVDSSEGAGTRFRLRLPVTRSVLRALLVEIAGDAFAFPLARIERAVEWSLNEVQTLEGRCYGQLEEQRIALVAAAEILELEGAPASGPHVHAVVIRDNEDCYAIEVDRFLGEREFAVRALDPRFGEVPHIGATALTDEGLPVLILDPDDLVRTIHALLSGGRRIGRPPQAEALRPPAHRVLIVDDSITVRELERRLLQNHGYEADVAVDGVEAWNALRLGRYDLVISDIDMPRMNGIELVKRVRADARLHDLPVLIVSYKDREEDRLRGLAAGANRYFAKSAFGDDSLIHAVREMLQESAR